MATDFDSLVIGAGVIGLAIARKLAASGQRVLVLEKASRAGTETSARNSEVIHAGIYYPHGSLKARLCVEGNKLLYDYCAIRGVETKRLGKLIVATTNEEETKLNAIASQAKANGVDDLQWLSQADVSKLEPELRCTKGLLSPATGIVDASGFMLALQGDAETHGTLFAFNTKFTHARKSNNVFIATATDAQAENSEITCHHIINCAGYGAHDVATAFDGFDTTKLPPRYLAKGNYCNVSGVNPFRHLVYPVPVAGALGIHATLDLAGALRLGPDIQWIEKIDYSMPPDLPLKFVSAVQAYWPAVEDRVLTPSYCGIRPKIHGPQDSFADFKIQYREEHGIPGLTNLFGIESPGLTAALALARSVARGSRG
jgi:L-2-hydroxyglutarate oxidase LhgO